MSTDSKAEALPKLDRMLVADKWREIKRLDDSWSPDPELLLATWAYERGAKAAIAAHEAQRGKVEPVPMVQASDAAIAVIKFVLDPETEDGKDFLSYWNEGEFDICRQLWPEAPEAVYIGADPLHPATQAEKAPSVQAVDNEQSAFETWFARENPSGDADSVQRQWFSSSDYEDFHAAPQQPSVLDSAIASEQEKGKG